MRGKIVVGTDFRAEADRAIDRALQLAHEWGEEVVLVHALEPERSDQPSKSELDDHMRSVLPDTQVKVKFRYPIERADVAIAAVAKEEGAALIVLGVARFNSLTDYLLGTAVDYVIRKSAVPVLVVKTRPQGPYCYVASATDFYPPSQKAVEKAADYFPDSTIYLVHAFHVPLEIWQRAEYVRAEIQKSEQKVFDEFVAKLRPATQERLLQRLVYGSPSSVLKKDLRESGADLVVLGTHGESALRHATVGSTAGELLRSLPIDTLVITASS